MSKKWTYKKVEKFYSIQHEQNKRQQWETKCGCAQWIYINSEGLEVCVVDGGCYGLNVCVPLKFVCWNSNVQSGGIRRWDF